MDVVKSTRNDHIFNNNNDVIQYNSANEILGDDVITYVVLPLSS